MITEVEISPSNRAKCKNCGRIIGKGEPRGIEKFFNNGHYIAYYSCYKCSEEAINKLKAKLDALIESQRKEIIAGKLMYGKQNQTADS